MKRLGNIYNSIYENLQLAEQKARKGKYKQSGIRQFHKNYKANLENLYTELKNKTYKISPYTTFKIYEPKERLIFRLPYKDRIVQHAIMLQIEQPLVSSFNADTYSCIKGRGIHSAQRAVQAALKDEVSTTYCLKFDIVKFYPSVDHDILKQLLRRKFKDKDLLNLLDEIINSAPGLPIGNLLSQFLANFYLSPFDHWIKQDKKVKYYFRYADDIVILSGSKDYLHRLFIEITKYLAEYKLIIKDNYQVFPVEARSIDFVGYCIRHKYTRLRKTIKQRFKKAIKRNRVKSIPPYKGWLKHCNARNLERTYFL